MTSFLDNAEALQQRAIALIKPLIQPDAEERASRLQRVPSNRGNGLVPSVVFDKLL
jgi:hypothetical protein